MTDQDQVAVLLSFLSLTVLLLSTAPGSSAPEAPAVLNAKTISAQGLHMREPRVFAQGAGQWVPRPASGERGDPSREALSREDGLPLPSSGST